VFPQTSAGTLGTPTLTPYSGVRLVRLGQLDGDGRLDVASADGSTLAVFLNNGLGGLKQPVTFPVAAGDLEVSDVTGDGRDDLVGLVGQNVSVSPQLAGGGFGAPATYPINANAWGTWGIGAGDVTGDGRNDVVVSYGGNFPNSFIAVLAQGANGTLGAPTAYPTYDIPQPIDTADFDIDGLTDVALLHGAFATAGVHRQRAGGTLMPEERYAIPYANPYRQHALAVGDFTGDGTPDIAVADFGNGLVVLRNVTAPTRAPAAPTLTTATADRAAVNLTWSAPSTAGGAPSGYRVYRGTASGNETLLATLGTATSFADNTAVPGTTYWYQVSAVDSRGEGARSSERSSAIPNPDAAAPTAPGSLALVVAGTSQLALDWSPSTDNVGVTGYRVYRNNSLIATASTTQFLDSGLAAGVSYSYRVTAIDAAGNESPSSSSITAKTVALAKGTTGTLAGVVYDAAGKPLANAVVSLAGKTMKTSTTGVWKLSNLKAASYPVSVSLAGYRSQTFTLAAGAGTTVLAVTALSP
jgi:chitodextrinase